VLFRSPLNGRPLVSYVAEALCESAVEKVFVNQCHGENLQEVLKHNDKLIFISCNEPYPSLADSLRCSVMGLLNYYGEYELSNKYILFVPCDIPAVKPQDFNALIEQVNDGDIDFYTTFINSRLLKRYLPHRRFRSIYFHELGGNFSQQGINIVSGRLFGYQSDSNEIRRLVIYDHDRKPVAGLSRIIDSFRKSRRSTISLLLFLSGFIFKRLVSRGSIGITMRLAFSWMTRRLTQSIFDRALSLSLNIKVALIRSQSIAFSADIDKPSDFEDVEKLMQY
jgi:CTP:molybdopterin cytidylyltransferase MocA